MRGGAAAHDRETVEGRGACQDHLRECSPLFGGAARRRSLVIRLPAVRGESRHDNCIGVGALSHRPKSPASTAWTFSLAISGECELDCSGTIDARFCAWRTPGG